MFGEEDTMWLTFHPPSLSTRQGRRFVGRRALVISCPRWPRRRFRELRSCWARRPGSFICGGRVSLLEGQAGNRV